MKKPNTDASKLRKKLMQNEMQRDKHVKKILSERGPIICGTFLIQGRKCGKENCKCTRGELHPNVVLSASEQGKTKNVYVRPADRERVQRRSKRFQNFRQARAELAKLANNTLELIDALQPLLTEPYPPQESRKSTRPSPRRRNVTKKRV